MKHLIPEKEFHSFLTSLSDQNLICRQITIREEFINCLIENYAHVLRIDVDIKQVQNYKELPIGSLFGNIQLLCKKSTDANIEVITMKVYE